MSDLTLVKQDSRPFARSGQCGCVTTRQAALIVSSMPRTRATPAEHPAPQALRGGCPLPGGLWVAGLRPGFLCAGFPWRPDGPRVTSVSVTRHARQLATPASWQSERVMVADAKLLIDTNATPTACLLPRSCEGRAAIRQTRHALSAGAIGQDMMSVCLCSAQKRTQHAAPSPKARAPRRSSSTPFTRGPEPPSPHFVTGACATHKQHAAANSTTRAARRAARHACSCRRWPSPRR